MITFSRFFKASLIYSSVVFFIFFELLDVLVEAFYLLIYPNPSFKRSSKGLNPRMTSVSFRVISTLLLPSDLSPNSSLIFFSISS